MGLTNHQPNAEFFTTECYGGPKQYDDFPTDGKHAFSMIAELFTPKSRGSVTLSSTDPMETPVVDCNYLAEPLDLLVLSEACRFGNEIMMGGAGTKGIVKGSWPPDARHHTYKTREEWVPYVKEHATTCKWGVLLSEIVWTSILIWCRLSCCGDLCYGHGRESYGCFG